ncbi:MAG: WxcM-like domain-containing protein [Muribaculaceae bacterium]|nr:WxcM-like domain-containing protein [Muribaculaceae bacterium]
MKDHPRIIDLPIFKDSRGNLTFIEEGQHLPFLLKRAYWIYDVPGGEARGGHAFFENEEVIIALSGSFDVITYQGNEKKIFSLNRSYYGLYVPKGTWREMNNFSTNALAFILASSPYNPQDYIREFKDYLNYFSHE